MTTNFGCGEARRAMAAQPSVYNEERNLLRLRAWEQRNQETSQTKEINPEDVPLFGEPYKTNKGDELSHRIQRMLGRYEDVNNPCSDSTEALPIPSCVSFLQSDQGQANTDKSTKTPFHNQTSQKGLSSNSYTSQPVRTFATASSPIQHGHSTTFSTTSLNQSQSSQFSHSVYQQKKSEVFSDLREYVNLPQERSAQSPDAKPLPFQHSTDNNIDMDKREIFERHKLQGSTDCPSGSSSTVDASTLNIKQSPKDGSLPQAKTNTLPSQTFPSLLSSKQPGIVMTQKPTAYVRPMDGQDQVVNESPVLKPSPEHYVPLPELINKTDLGKAKEMPQFIETTVEEAQCVEDILREMTHSWPPLLTAIRTPSIGEPSKSPFPAKEAQRVSSCSEQKNRGPSPGGPCHFSQQSSSTSFEVTRSSFVETSSSSDSESSAGSESDSESSTEEPPQPPESSSVKTRPDSPAVSHGDWQLGNWIRSSQQNSSSDGRSDALVSESPSHKLLPQPQALKSSSADPTEECRPQLSSQQKELTDRLAMPHRFSKNPQDNYCFKQSKKNLPADVSSCSNARKLLKPAAAGCPDRSEGAFSINCGSVTIQTKDPCYTDTPKVKMKTEHCKKDKSNTKKDIKRSKHTKCDKQKAGSEVALILYGHCSSCGVRYPNPCSCPSRSPAQSDQVSPPPPVRISCNKPKADTFDQSNTKMPQKSTRKDSENSCQAAKGSWNHYQPPRSLLVKIELSLLSRVPQTSSIHRGISSNAKRPALVIEQDDGGSDVSKAHKHVKASKKSQNVDVESKTPSKKKQKLENKNTLSTHPSVKQESSSNPADVRVKKKAKKHLQNSNSTSKNAVKDSKLEKCLGKARESTKEAIKKKDSHKHNKSSAKQIRHLQPEKLKLPKSSHDVPSGSQTHIKTLTNRSLLTFDESQFPVKHYIKEAKRLKHKADAESDKLSKAFNYLDAAMFFVESGIAMEKDPQTSMSSYTMFAETVELLKFVLKLKNPVDSSAASSEKDFLVLCMRCQCILQMAMFRHKQKTAVKYSKTLTDHFNSLPSVYLSVRITENPSPNMPSPASTSSGLGPGSSYGAGGLGVGPFGATVAVPQEIEQVAFTYVNITVLFLNAHDIWEQAEELTHKGSGLLAELDTLLGPLSLTSSLSSMVHYTRQGVHWLRLDGPKV
ncbi:LOW QUALITY PROTEIN: AF4/FMR2 family member 1-like [Xenentodon cancila]